MRKCACGKRASYTHGAYSYCAAHDPNLAEYADIKKELEERIKQIYQDMGRYCFLARGNGQKIEAKYLKYNRMLQETRAGLADLKATVDQYKRTKK